MTVATCSQHSCEPSRSRNNLHPLTPAHRSLKMIEFTGYIFRFVQIGPYATGNEM